MRTETVRFEPYKLIVSDSGRRTHRSSYDVRLIRFFFRVSKPLFHRTSFSESFPVRVGAFREVFSIFVVVYWIIVCVWGGGARGNGGDFNIFDFVAIRLKTMVGTWHGRGLLILDLSGRGRIFQTFSPFFDNLFSVFFAHFTNWLNYTVSAGWKCTKFRHKVYHKSHT